MNYKFFKPNGNGLENQNSLFANNSFSGIIGPTGSGKTSLICNILKNRNNQEKFTHIFITSPQNMALDKTFSSFNIAIRELNDFDLETNNLKNETQYKSGINPYLYFVDPENLDSLYEMIKKMNEDYSESLKLYELLKSLRLKFKASDSLIFDQDKLNEEEERINVIEKIYTKLRFPYNNLKILFIFEDSTGSRILMDSSNKSPLFKLIKMRRHFLTSCIFVMHSYKAILAPVFRAQFTEIFLMSGLNIKIINDVFEEMNGNIFGKTKQELIEEYNSITGTYSKDDNERAKKRYNNIGYFIIPRKRVLNLKTLLL